MLADPYGHLDAPPPPDLRGPEPLRPDARSAGSTPSGPTRSWWPRPRTSTPIRRPSATRSPPRWASPCHDLGTPEPFNSEPSADMDPEVRAQLRASLAGRHRSGRAPARTPDAVGALTAQDASGRPRDQSVEGRLRQLRCRSRCHAPVKRIYDRHKRADRAPLSEPGGRSQHIDGTIGLTGDRAGGALDGAAGNDGPGRRRRPGDGTTSATAGASCWGIKQQFPRQRRRHLLAQHRRPRPPAAVLLRHDHRGRRLGPRRPRPRGLDASTRSARAAPPPCAPPPTGSGAFAPAALDTATINGPAQRPDRQHARPTASASSGPPTPPARTRQDSSSSRSTQRGPGASPPASCSTRSSSTAPPTTAPTPTTPPASVAGQTTNGLARRPGHPPPVHLAWANHDNKAGFSFGTGVSGGSNSSTNHLWTSAPRAAPSRSPGCGSGPQIANSAAGFTPIPAGGYAAAPSRPSSRTAPSWRPGASSGIDHTDETTDRAVQHQRARR